MSDHTPRIFVGTMHCGEADYDECVKAILAQENVSVKHVIIADLPEKEAHNRLWQSWREVQSTHDVFVKIDADTVLESSKTLFQISELFRENPRLTGVQAPLHDYMTDGFINGLNCFSPKVVFNDTKDELYCDRKVDVNHDITISSENVPEHLKPAGFHCHFANEAQSFHYGLHRMLKGQTVTLDHVFSAWAHYRDRIRLFALVGAHMAPRFTNNRKFNYGDQEFQQALLEVQTRYDELVKHYASLVR